MKYEVIAKCGHVGRNNYVLKSFAVEAESAVEAAAVARSLPRVKHHHKDAIRSVCEIDDARYYEIIEMQRYDPYFHCSCVQEQRALCTDLEILPEIRRERIPTIQERTSRKDYYIGKEKIRNPKKVFTRYYIMNEGLAS